MLDRIDLCVQVEPVPIAEISRAPGGETTQVVARRVEAGRARQHARQGGLSNAEAGLEALAISPLARTLAEQAAERLHLSARGYTRLLRVARTIADLAACMEVERTHVAEALGYRHRFPGRG